MRTIAIALTLLLAGCVSAGEDAVESADMNAETTAAAGAQMATVTAQPVPASTVIGVPTAFPFSYEGSTGTGYCAPAGPGMCVGTTIEASENTFMPLVHEGKARGVLATLTWTALTPATQNMYIAAFAMIDCGEDCFETSGEPVFVSGTSPLTLDAPSLVTGDNESIALHVGWMRPTPPAPQPLYYQYTIEQAFSVEGTVTALVNTTA